MHEARLRDAGLRVTRQRLTVLEVLAAAHRRAEHLTVGDLAERARGALGSVSTQAVYDCLEALAAAGLVRRIEPAGSPARYEVRVGDNHHHLVCRGCGGVTDVDCVVGHAPCLDPPAAHGFVVDEAEVVYWGVCPRCAADPARSPSSPTSPAPIPAPIPEELQVR